MTLQPQRFHATLPQREWMVIPFRVQGVLNRRSKLQLHCHAHSLSDDTLSVSKTAIPPRGQYSWPSLPPCSATGRTIGPPYDELSLWESDGLNRVPLVVLYG